MVKKNLDNYDLASSSITWGMYDTSGTRDNYFPAKALRDVNLPCRFEKFRYEKDGKALAVILDAAHNPVGVSQFFDKLFATLIR